MNAQGAIIASASHRAEVTAYYCDGSEAALRDLYAMAAPRLLAYVIGLSRDRATAEEILQATFMKLPQSRAGYIRGADPLPWLCTIARHVYLDEVRRRKRSRVQLTRDGAVVPAPRGLVKRASHRLSLIHI